MAVATLSCPPVPSDDCLLARLANGDRTALEELFGRYRSMAYRVAYRLLGHEADALDAVQDGFVKAFTHLNSFQGRSSFKTWLLRVVSNAALDLGRQRARRESHSVQAAQVRNQQNSQPIVEPDPAEGLQRADVRRLVNEALGTLSEAQRQTFVLHADAEMSYREVADALGISIGTVMSRLYYTRQKLRAYLAERITP